MTADELRELIAKATPGPVTQGTLMTPADWTLAFALHNDAPQIVADKERIVELEAALDRIVSKDPQWLAGERLARSMAGIARKALEAKP